MVFRSKFTEFLSFLKQQIGFPSNFPSIFSIMNIIPLYFFSWSFKYFQQKEPIKVQIWWNFIWAVKIFLKFCTLIGSFCKNHMKFQLKKYRRVISDDIEEWCNVYRKTEMWFQIWHEGFGEFSAKHSKVLKFHFDGLFLSKVWGLS